MSNTSTVFRRYVWLINTVRSKRLTREEICRRWANAADNPDGNPMPIKTFHNHLHAIEDIFALRIRCNRHAGSTYEIENAEDVENNALSDWLLSTLSVSNLIQESGDLRHRIVFENVPSGEKFLVPLIEAMRDSRRVRLVYEKFRNPDLEPVIFAPYMVKVFRRRWYVVGLKEGAGTDGSKGSMRAYALDRIRSIELTETGFTLPPDFDPSEYYDDCYGITRDENLKPRLIRIRVKGNRSKYLDTLPLHHSQNRLKTEGDHVIYEYYLRPAIDFIQELLSMGDEVEVLSPDSFREEVAEIIRNMGEFYR